MASKLPAVPIKGEEGRVVESSDAILPPQGQGDQPGKGHVQQPSTHHFQTLDGLHAK